VLTTTYQKLEATAKRLDMIALLLELFVNTSIDVVTEVAYLTKDHLQPG
jgi:hypothetical protein